METIIVIDENKQRRDFLESLSDVPRVLEMVSNYCHNPFDPERMPDTPVFPMDEEGHVADWRQYVDGMPEDPFGFLQKKLPQLNIPVQEGVSQSKAYSEVIRRGNPFEKEAFSGRLRLERPDLFQLIIHEHPSGALPVMLTTHRSDFETLIQALAFRSEPKSVSPSVNAHMISGLINWDRVRRYETTWKAQHPAAKASVWPMEMARVAKFETWRFYDRFIVLGVHPYSSVSAAALGLDWDEQTWLEKSTNFRLEHEFAHYTTMRLYGKMRNNLLDEMICDWAGMTATMDHFNAEWFLVFMGLQGWPAIRTEGRVHTYRQDLNRDAFHLLCELTVRAAEGLESLTKDHYDDGNRQQFLTALTRLTLELMACPERDSFFQQAYAAAGRLLNGIEKPDHGRSPQAAG